MKNKWTPRELALLGLLSGLLILMSVTPLGYLRVGGLSITLNMIPVAVAAMALGYRGGAVTALVFGLTSFASAMTGGSVMGAAMMAISPVRTAVQSILPRLLMGLAVPAVYRAFRKIAGGAYAGFAAGFAAAALNTALYMTSLMLLFGSSDYVQGLMNGRNVIVFVCAYVGINAVFEVICATAVTGLLGRMLEKAHLMGGTGR